MGAVHPLSMKTLSWIIFAAIPALIFAQVVPKPGNPAARVSPQDPVPGLVARVYMDGSSDLKKFPTHLVAAVADGHDFVKNYREPAHAELRGVVTKMTETFYIATGFIQLEKDTEIKFEMDELHCYVNGKDLGPGTYNKVLKKGRHTVEITRSWGKGLKGCAITDSATGAPAVFYTGDMLNRELKRSFKIEGRTYKGKQLTPKPAAP